MSKVLVIIVTYNAHKWLRQCLDSVDTKRYDVLVVDNASTDDTLQILCEYPRTMVHKMEINHGFGQANNVGFRYAIEYDYDYVLLLNQDAWLLPDTIDRLIAIQKQHPEYWILSPMQWNTERGGMEKQFKTYLPKIWREQTNELFEVPFVNAAIWLIPTSRVKMVGGFDPLFLHYGEDNDYVHRVHFYGGKVGIDVHAIAYHERECHSVIDNNKLLYRTKLVYLNFLKNVNKSYIVNILMLIGNSLKHQIKALVRFRFYETIVYVTALHSCLKQSGNVYQHRITSMEIGAFL